MADGLNTPNLSRRAMFGGAAQIAVAAGLAALPATASAMPGRAAWEAALAKLHAADRAFEVVFDAAGKIPLPTLPKKPVCMLSLGGDWGLNDDLEAIRAVKMSWHHHVNLSGAAKQAVVDSEIEQIGAWQAEAGAAKAPYDRAEAALRVASDALADAQENLVETPAPDLAAVVVKLELVRDHEFDLEPVIADLRRMGSN